MNQHDKIGEHSGSSYVEGDAPRAVTVADLRKAEARYQRAFRHAEEAREARNAAVRAALAEGWTHARISEATGLSRGRIGQVAHG